MDLAREYDRFAQLLKDEKPDTMVHFAEQRAAPYSMKDAACKRYTVENNLGATHNVLCGIVESGLDIHLVHLGTMGVCKHPPQHHPLTCPPLLRNKMGRAADRGADRGVVRWWQTVTATLAARSPRATLT